MKDASLFEYRTAIGGREAIIERSPLQNDSSRSQSTSATGSRPCDRRRQLMAAGQLDRKGWSRSRGVRAAFPSLTLPRCRRSG